MPLDNIHYRTGTNHAFATQVAKRETADLRATKDADHAQYLESKELFDIMYSAVYDRVYDSLL
jgi:hypothetical protein